MAINLDKMREKLDDLDGKKRKNQKNDEFFRPDFGEHELRILPSEDGEPYKEIYFHYNVGTAVMCPKRNFGEYCAVCEYAHSLWKEGGEESQKMAKGLFARQRFFSNILVRGKEEEGPKPYGYGRKMFKKLVEHTLDPDYGDITDPENGRDIKLSYEKGAQFPIIDFSVKPATKPIAKSKKEIKDILDKIKPLESFFERKTSAEVQKVLETFLGNPYDGEEVKKYGAVKSPEVQITDLDKAIEELADD